MVVEVELKRRRRKEAVSSAAQHGKEDRPHAETNLDHFVTEFEDNHVLHPEVLLHKVQPRDASRILEAVVVLPIQTFEHVALEMFEQVDLVVQVVWMFAFTRPVVFPDEHGSRATSRDILHVPITDPTVNVQ